jgi:hypothetical protein
LVQIRSGGTYFVLITVHIKVHPNTTKFASHPTRPTTSLVLFVGPVYIEQQPIIVIETLSVKTTPSTSDQNPLAVFMYALKSSESQRQYPKKFKVFLDYVDLTGSLEEQAKEFVERIKKDPRWLQERFINFITYQKERIKKKEIAEGTIGNYYKATKLFCEMNFDHPIINWKKVARGQRN